MMAEIDRTYAGIGSRQTPVPILRKMQLLAVELRTDHGFTLRSGRAPGADQAFEAGAGDDAEIYKPWRAFEKEFVNSANPMVKMEPKDEALVMAAEYHPKWEALSWGGKRLHGRNMHIVMGWDLDDPVDFLVCWTPNGAVQGGTAQALRVAEDLAIPIFNYGSISMNEEFNLSEVL
jgi:hypothetical protein